MRIVYLCDEMGIHDQRFLDKLSKTDNEVYLITYHPQKELPREIGSLKNIRIIHEYSPLTFGQGAEKINRLFRKLACWLAFTRSFLRLRKLIKTIRPDILHAGWLPASGFMAALTGFHPLLLMPMGSDILIVPEMNRRLAFKIRYTIRRADMITCDCEYVKDRIVERYNYPAERIVVFPRGIDLGRFHPDYDGEKVRAQLGWQDKKIIIMPRNFRPVYGVEYFIRSLPAVLAAEPDTRIIMCGSGPLEKEYKRMVADLGLGSKVRFLGEIENTKLPFYLKSADIYVSASLSDGTSLSLLEAMACALPVVVTDVPSNLEWVREGENGYIVPRRNSEELADRLIALLKDKDLRRRFGAENSDQAKRRADWDQNFKKLDGIYSKMLEPKS